MCKSVLLSQRSNKEKDTLYANTKLDQGIYTTVCPRSSGPFYVVINYIKWVTNYWTYSTLDLVFFYLLVLILDLWRTTI